VFLICSLSWGMLPGMSDPSPLRPDRPPLHALLDAAMTRRLENVRHLSLARGSTAEAAREDMRAALLARYPALPLSMIDSAVSALEAAARSQPPHHRAVRRFARRLGFRFAREDSAS
jgi:hypothetical protein